MTMTETDKTTSVTAFAAACEWTGVTSEDRAPWLALRRTMLTAGDIAAVMGEDDRRSALDVYIDKVIDRHDEVLAITDPRFWGSALEQPILQTVATYYGWKYRRGGYLLRSRKHPWLGATLDAEIDRNDGSGWLPFEGKTTQILHDWDEDSGKLPLRVLIQVQSQLLVSGAPRAIVFALVRGCRPVEIPIDASPEFHAIIVTESREFLDLVDAGTPPIPDGSEAFGRALQRLYPTADGSAVALPIEAIEWTAEYQALTEKIKDLELRKAHFAQLLKNSIGKATYGVLPSPVGDKSCWRWRAPENSETRTLIALKRAPPGRRVYERLPAANDTFLDALAKSVVEDDDGTTAPIRFGSRRRSKR